MDVSSVRKCQKFLRVQKDKKRTFDSSWDFSSRDPCGVKKKKRGGGAEIKRTFQYLLPPKSNQLQSTRTLQAIDRRNTHKKG